MHRLDLAVIGGESFQRANPEERFIVPGRPKADLAGLQSRKIQGMRTTGRCLCAGTGQMGMQKIDNARVTEVPLDNSHHGWLPITNPPSNHRPA
jgi:hypothetical protein